MGFIEIGHPELFAAIDVHQVNVKGHGSRFLHAYRTALEVLVSPHAAEDHQVCADGFADFLGKGQRGVFLLFDPEPVVIGLNLLKRDDPSFVTGPERLVEVSGERTFSPGDDVVRIERELTDFAVYGFLDAAGVFPGA